MKSDTMVLYSGATKGAEAEFGRLAEQNGIQELNYTFAGHPNARTRGIQELTDEELLRGDVSQVPRGGRQAAVPTVWEGRSHAKPAPSRLRRSAAFQGQSPREVRGPGGKRLRTGGQRESNRLKIGSNAPPRLGGPVHLLMVSDCQTLQP